MLSEIEKKNKPAWKVHIPASRRISGFCGASARPSFRTSRSAGDAAQPLNQPVECIDRDAMLGSADSFRLAIAKFAEAADWEPTFTFRLGVAERAR
ncbi:MAG: hypothetical protein ACLQIQ_07260 [Beijerinckiaceae bacterium]